MTEGDGGERVSYTTKELLARLETTLGEKIDSVGKKVDVVTDKHDAEIRDVRHRVSNLETASQLRMSIEVASEKTAERTRADVETLKTTVNDLQTQSASQQAVDAFKKWLIGTVILGFGALILAVIQMFQAPN